MSTRATPLVSAYYPVVSIAAPCKVRQLYAPCLRHLYFDLCFHIRLVFGFVFPMVQSLRPFAVACGSRRLLIVAVCKVLLHLAALAADVCVKFCDCHGIMIKGRLLASNPAVVCSFYLVISRANFGLPFLCFRTSLLHIGSYYVNAGCPTHAINHVISV